MNDVAISVINYKTKELTGKCLKSILEKKWKVSFKIFLIDNASNDGSVEFFKKEFPGVEIIESDKNLGFARGHNLVLEKIKNFKYWLILNSDTELEGEVLDGMVEFMDQNLEVGISSCKVLGYDGKPQANSGDLPFGVALLSWLFNLETLGIKSSFHRFDSDYYKKISEVGWLQGNFLLIRKEVVDEIGGLNNHYFMYFEDVEYCIKARKKGYKIMINPNYHIKHLSGASSKDPRFAQWKGEFRGILYFYQKNYGLLVGFLLKLLIYFSIILRIVGFFISGKINYSKTYAKVIISI